MKIQPVLLRAEDGVLGRFGDAELHDALGLDLDGFPGLRVAAHAGGAVLEDEFADAGQREGVFSVLVSERGQMVEDFASLLLGERGFFSDRGDELGFRECFSHNFIFFDGVLSFCLIIGIYVYFTFIFINLRNSELSN